jgi:hypothetical protein
VVKCAFTVSGASPTLARSALVSCTTRAVKVAVLTVVAVGVVVAAEAGVSIRLKSAASEATISKGRNARAAGDLIEVRTVVVKAPATEGRRF